MFLNEAFMQVFEELDNLTEAKADTQRLIDFAGEETANKFLQLRNRLKSPENDLYYWIKNKQPEELVKTLDELENTKTKSQLKREAEAGADLVQETEHWLVYHITTFEAAQKYGRDSQWCITGVNNYGDRYWQDYRQHNIEFYFFITKGNYDPRGVDSKFALALYPNDTAEIYNQRDDLVDSVDEVPYYDEISIDGTDLEDFDFVSNHLYCCDCDCEIDEDEACWDDCGDVYCYDCWQERFFSCDFCGDVTCHEDGFELPNGDKICERCFNNSDYIYCPECDELVHIDDIMTTIFEDEMCSDCFNDFLDTDRGHAETFVHYCEGYSEGDFEDEAFVNKLIRCWNTYKAELGLPVSEILDYESNFIENAKNCDGVVIDPDVFIEVEDSDDSAKSSYYIAVEDSNKSQENYDIPEPQALKEIVGFINKLSQEEKDKVRLNWDWLDDDGELSDLIVSVYGPSENTEERTISNWGNAENMIRRALGLGPKE